MAISDSDWHGPFISEQGAHFLRITERHPARRARFEEVQNWIGGEWTLARSRELIEAELSRLAPDYRVEIHGPGEAGG